MIEIQVLVPVRSNDGVTFTPAHHASFDAFVVSVFGVVSRLPGVVTGQWTQDGVTYVDETIVVVIAVASIVDAAKIADVVAFAKAHYAQLAIYIRYLGHSEVL